MKGHTRQVGTCESVAAKLDSCFQWNLKIIVIDCSMLLDYFNAGSNFQRGLGLNYEQFNCLL